ncbi:MAG TPA: hypothetical protein VJ864_05595, partial [Candidatus Binatia bacterium]|nr:hypothetical protein [Candidatus Binatia bacterium]
LLFHCRKRDAKRSEVVSDDENGQRHRDKTQNYRFVQLIFGLHQMPFVYCLVAVPENATRISIGVCVLH